MGCKCGICDKEIETKQDDYVKLIDYKQGHFLMEGFYHLRCYQDKINKAIMRNKEKLRQKLPKIIEKLRRINHGNIER